MATTLRLDYDRASAQARIVEANADAINRTLQNLLAEVEANVGNNNVWSGVSAREFLDKWNNCADSFNSFVNHIRTIQQKIDYTSTEVSTFDQQM
ncbi:MAG: hypothetical protein E7164_02200 [Firmicutes bacterium]|nr:hypothetical protein [Bacillota bacterium]